MAKIYDNKKSQEQSETQTINRRIYFGLIIALVIIIGGSFIFVSSTYNQGLKLISQGEYEKAIEKLDRIKYTSNRAGYVISLCEAHVLYEQEDDFWSACTLMTQIMNKDDFNYQNEEILVEDITKFLNVLVREKNKIEDEKERHIKETLSNELPYEGLNEEYINYTSLGHYTTKEEKAYYTAYTWYEDDIEDSKHLLCKVEVVRKELSTERYVSEVYLYGELNPSKPSYSSKPSSSSDDDYDIDDYGDPEDFYYENYDDFLDYYDAEDYYYEHKKR